MKAKRAVKSVAWVLGLIVVAALAGCGGGDTSSPVSGGAADPGPSGSSPPAGSAPQGAVARLEVSPSTLLLTSAGATRSMTVRAFDANGSEVRNPPLSFSSSQPGQVAVAPDGVVQAITPTGTATLIVTSGAVTAVPVLAVVAELAPGALTVMDSQVVVPPQAVDPAAPPGPEFRYRVSLTGVGTPAPGTPIIGLGDLPVGGRVVTATVNGAQTDLVLEVGELPSLFRNLQIDMSLSPAQMTALLQPLQNTRRPVATGGVRPTGLLGLDRCKSDSAVLPLTGELTLKADPSLSLRHVIDLKDSVVQRLVLQVSGTVDVSGKATLALGAAYSGNITCKIPLARIPVPISGPLSFFVAPVVPLEARLKLGAALSANVFSIGAEIKQKADFDMGVTYTPADDVKLIDTLTLHDPIVKTTMSGPLSTSVRAKANLFVGLGTGVALGNILASLDLVDLSVGPELEGKFGGVFDAASDPLYKTGYELKAKVALGPGDEIKNALKRLLGSDKAVSIGVKLVEKSLAKTAQGSSQVADRDTYQAGQTVKFTVKLDPGSVGFPAVGYNVLELWLYRVDQVALTATPVGHVTATPGQTEFTFAWVADSAGTVRDKVSGKSNFHVFAVDNVLTSISSVLPFEAGAVSATDPPPNSPNCDASKRFCAVPSGRGPYSFSAGNVDVFLDENANFYAAAWGQDGGFLMPFNDKRATGACFSSLNPPRAGMPSRSGKFIVQNETAPDWRVLDHSANVCDPKQTFLPAQLPDGRVIQWTALSDVWAVGYAKGPLPTDQQPVRIDIRAIDAVTNRYTNPVGVFSFDGAATDVNDAGTVVGISSGNRIFVWQNDMLAYPDPPLGSTGCFHVTVNAEGSLLAACTTAASGTYAYVRMASSSSWTRVTSTNNGPEPAFFYPGRVNSRGQVMTATTVNQLATDIVLWEAGQTVSLLASTGFLPNPLGYPSGVPTQLFSRAAINDQGQIAIMSVTEIGGTRNVYLVTPNPAYQP